MKRRIRKLLLGAALAVTAPFLFLHNPAVQAAASDSIDQDKLFSMLATINKIRKPRDIQLDCEKFVYPYLGRHDRVGYYIDLFAASGISAEVVRQRQDYYIGFEIFSPHLKKIPNSRFRTLDVVVVQFLTTDNEPSATVRSCTAILKAAPAHL